MKSAWDKIFHTDAPLTAEEREQALRELVKAVADVTKMQSSSEHERIKEKIAVMLTKEQ